MNEYQERMMQLDSIECEVGGTTLCAFCGRPAQARHHIVPRSQGGTDGPTVPVCGRGNESGCHRLLHDHELFIDNHNGRDDGWVYMRVTERNWETWGVARGRRTYESIPSIAMWYPLPRWEEILR